MSLNGEAVDYVDDIRADVHAFHLVLFNALAHRLHIQIKDTKRPWPQLRAN